MLHLVPLTHFHCVTFHKPQNPWGGPSTELSVCLRFTSTSLTRRLAESHQGQLLFVPQLQSRLKAKPLSWGLSLQHKAKHFGSKKLCSGKSICNLIIYNRALHKIFQFHFTCPEHFKTVLKFWFRQRVWPLVMFFNWTNYTMIFPLKNPLFIVAFQILSDLTNRGSSIKEKEIIPFLRLQMFSRHSQTVLGLFAISFVHGFTGHQWMPETFYVFWI